MPTIQERALQLNADVDAFLRSPTAIMLPDAVRKLIREQAAITGHLVEEVAHLLGAPDGK